MRAYMHLCVPAQMCARLNVGGGWDGEIGGFKCVHMCVCACPRPCLRACDPMCEDGMIAARLDG